MEELTKISGIGQATAKKLAEAGFADLATLAAADPQKAPEGFTPEDWQKWIAAASAAATPAPPGNEDAAADDQQQATQPAIPDVPDTTPKTAAKGPVCHIRVRYRRQYFCPGEHLPVDISAKDLAELKTLKAIS